MTGYMRIVRIIGKNSDAFVGPEEAPDTHCLQRRIHTTGPGSTRVTLRVTTDFGPEQGASPPGL